MKIDFAKTCLAVLLGVAIGVVFTILIRPRAVKAQGGTVFVESVSVPNVGATATANIKGTRIIGFVCPTSGACVIASQ
jgi:hypothetical protein